MSKWMETTRAVVTEPRFGFDLVRIYLGIALFVRGALFIADPNRFLAFAGQTDSWFWPMFLAHYVALAHLCGGLLLALGLVTRLAAAVQVPILVGAVFVVHWNQGLLSVNQSLELAGLVLALLVSYAVFGSGPLSVDQRLFRDGLSQALREKLRRRRQRRRSVVAAA